MSGKKGRLCEFPEIDGSEIERVEEALSSGGCVSTEGLNWPIVRDGQTGCPQLRSPVFRPTRKEVPKSSSSSEVREARPMGDGECGVGCEPCLESGEGLLRASIPGLEMTK